jgi:hypothetical protein
MPDCLTHGCVWDLGGEELGSQDSTGVEGICYYLHLLVVPRILGFWDLFWYQNFTRNRTISGKVARHAKMGHRETVFTDDNLSVYPRMFLFIIRESGTTRVIRLV